ncbi:MAG: two-component system sensor histidine kinase RegB, partial [Lentisphaeria bacterium]
PKQNMVSFNIVNDGPAITPELSEQIGRPFFSTKPDGWGLGVYLSNSTLEQFGGNVTISNHAPSGTLTEIKLLLMKTSV